MKKAIIPAAILCTVLFIGMGNQSDMEATPAPTQTPAAPTPEVKITRAETARSKKTAVKCLPPTGGRHFHIARLLISHQ